MELSNNSKNTFRLTGKKFQMEWQTLHLSPRLKREATICNLFANHGLPVTDIIRILDENYGNVIQSLISHQFLLDRRLLPREATSDEPLCDEDHANKPRNRLMEGLDSLFGFRE